LRASRIAGEYRFVPSDVEHFVQSQRVIVQRPDPSLAAVGDPFTRRARRVMGFAPEEAERYRHFPMDTEHFLLAIMREEDGAGAKILRQLSVQPQAVREQIEQLHPAQEPKEGQHTAQAPEPPGRRPLSEEARGLIEKMARAQQQPAGQHVGPLSPQVGAALKMAIEEARSLDDALAGTQHLLLGLLGQETGIAAQVLGKAGITLEAVRDAVRQGTETD
jgi:ATP-dependent Clp protease ATP-binding subunit ClpC